MNSKQEDIDELIVTCLADSTDKEAWKELKQWTSASPEHEHYFRLRQEIWFSALDGNESARFGNPDDAYALFRRRVEKTGHHTVSRKSFRIGWQKSLRYAAAAAFVAAMCFYAYWLGEAQADKYRSNVTVQVPDGSRTQLTLPDGSKVWLNAGSQITYAPSFGRHNRHITLSGEGYFEVARNAELPFFVKSRNLQVRVIGTKFTFSDYANDKEAFVALAEGKVALHNLMQPDKETLLRPNERAILDKANGKIHTEAMDMRLQNATPHEALFFDEVLLTEVVKQLEKSYDVQIRITTDSLKEVRLYGNFIRHDQSIEDILNVLAATGKIHYRREGRNITLY